MHERKIHYDKIHQKLVKFQQPVSKSTALKFNRVSSFISQPLNEAKQVIVKYIRYCCSITKTEKTTGLKRFGYDYIQTKEYLAD